MLTTYTRDELNRIATCIDIALKSKGVEVLPLVLPLLEKTEQIAQEMDVVKSVAENLPPVDPPPQG